jgi:hypothetical protein
MALQIGLTLSHLGEFCVAEREVNCGQPFPKKLVIMYKKAAYTDRGPRNAGRDSGTRSEVFYQCIGIRFEKVI